MWDLSSLIRDWTHVSCIARQILNHETTKEVLRISVSYIIVDYVNSKLLIFLPPLYDWLQLFSETQMIITCLCVGLCKPLLWNPLNGNVDIWYSVLNLLLQPLPLQSVMHMPSFSQIKPLTSPGRDLDMYKGSFPWSHPLGLVRIALSCK